MTKYRICKNKSGDYKIQQKPFMFWSDYSELNILFGYYTIQKTILFKTKEEAEQKIIELKEQEQKRKNDKTWECSDEY